LTTNFEASLSKIDQGSFLRPFLRLFAAKILKIETVFMTELEPLPYPISVRSVTPWQIGSK